MEREFGDMLAIKYNYPKYVVIIDERSVARYEDALHMP